MHLNSVPLVVKVLVMFPVYIVIAVWKDSQIMQYAILNPASPGLLTFEAIETIANYSILFIVLSGINFTGLYLYRRFRKDKSATNGKLLEKAVIAAFVLLVLLLFIW